MAVNTDYIPANIPEEIKQLPQWVVWGVDTSKPKCPFNPATMRPAKAGDPVTWSDYETAASRVNAGRAGGVGFEFNDNGIYGIDLDKVLDNGILTPEAREIVAALDSYTEISPSGTGLHILVKADGVDLKANRKGFIEIYCKERYFTITGNLYGEPKPIESRANELQTVYDRFLKPKQTQPKPPPQMPVNDAHLTGDSEYLEIGLQKDQVFIGLWSGSRPNGNESADDQALLNKLAYWCNANESLMHSSFLQSPHYAGKGDKHLKKCNRADYMARTIQKAVSDLRITAREKNSQYEASRNAAPTESTTTDSPQFEQKNGVVLINPFATPETRRRYSWNDIGMGYLFADMYQDVCRYVPEAKSWYCYNGKVWRHDVGGMKIAQYARDLTNHLLVCAKHIEDDKVKEAWISFVGKRIKKTARDTMLADAASVYPVSILEFDKDPYIFNCQNCTLNLKSFTRHKHRPGDFLSKISNVIFDTSAKCERWEKFISEIMRDNAEAAKFLQKTLGYALTGDTSMECFFILYGATTRNGKGTSMETTLHLLGDYGRTAQPETIAQKHIKHSSGPSEDIARLKGARFVNMSEPDKGLRLNSALVKQMTGGDTLTARYLNQNSFEFKPEFKLFINTNHLPKVADDSIFNSGRIKLIPFERHFEENEQDKGLKAFFRQPENISGIFNWFVEGLKLLGTEGLDQPKVVTDATNEYRDNSDTIGMFIKDCLDPCDSNYVKIQQVYSEYGRWCEESGYNAKNKSNFIDELNKKGIYKRHRTLGFVVYNYMLKSDCPFTGD